LHNRGASAAAFTVILKENYRLGKTRGNDRFLYRNIQVRPNEQRRRQTVKNISLPRLNNVKRWLLRRHPRQQVPSASVRTLAH